MHIAYTFYPYHTYLLHNFIKIIDFKIYNYNFLFLIYQFAHQAFKAILALDKILVFTVVDYLIL